jgi:hypothetical protein
MFAACISWARSSSPRFPSSLMECSKESRPPSPPWWYDTATSTWESGSFRLRARSRIVIAVHAASEALSNSWGFAPAAMPPLPSGPPIENTDAPARPLSLPAPSRSPATTACGRGAPSSFEFVIVLSFQILTGRCQAWTVSPPLASA